MATKHKYIRAAIDAMPIPGIVFVSGSTYYAGESWEQHHLSDTERVVHKVNPKCPWGDIIHPAAA